MVDELIVIDSIAPPSNNFRPGGQVVHHFDDRLDLDIFQLKNSAPSKQSQVFSDFTLCWNSPTP
jgi:hypothetical protein